MTATNEGRIPFRLRLGITGNRRIADEDEAIGGAVVREVQRLRDALAAIAPATPLQLAVVTQLAEGPDRFVAQALGREPGARLEVVLPAERERYAAQQGFAGDSRAEYERLLGEAASVTELNTDAQTEEDWSYAYAAAGERVIERCDVLLAVWDGRRGGRGGAADTVARAATRHVPCISIVTDPAVADAFPSEPELAPLRRALREFDVFNRASIRGDPGDAGLPTAAASEMVRAAALAGRHQRWFLTLSALSLASAVLAAIAFGLSVTYAKTNGWAWTELGSLVVAGGAFLAVRLGRFHPRWLSCRLLTERLRSAHYLAPTGASLSTDGRLEGVYVGAGESEWIMRAAEEVWARRPAADARDVGVLRDAIEHEWIGGQIAYHEAAARLHRGRARVLEVVAALLFLATLIAAAVHATAEGGRLPEFLAITFPAAAASVGAWLSIRQHRALERRSEQMLGDLRRLQADVAAAEPRELAVLAANAARVIAQETGDWLGAMWFLEMEHV
jgi:hypothetical protein